MKAILSKVPGGPDALALEEVPPPAYGPGDVLVDVKAAAVNFPDVLIIQDLYQVKPPRPFAPGSEFAGVVRAVGASVTRWRAGDRVFGHASHGGFAEQAVLPENAIFRAPPAMPLEDAACLLLTFATSHHALKDRAGLRPGETLLVLGAAGGAGVAAVELGKAMGARVIAAASSAEKVAFAQAAGAEVGLVYPSALAGREGQRAFSEEIRRASGGGVDVVYDAVGGDYAEPALRALNFGGRFLVIGFPAGIPRLPLNLPLLKGSSIVGVFWGAAMERDPALYAANVEELLGLYAAGKIKPRISQRFPLARAPEAIALLQQRKAQGKIVVEIG